MEGKTVILSVLIMSLVMAQIQVEAKRVCCPSKCSRRIYNRCRLPQQACLRISCCKIVSGNKCPPGWRNEILENSGDEFNEYCNLGCESSVCGALTNLENSDASEIVLDQQVNEALEECTKTCSTLCAKGSKTASDQTASDQTAPDQIA